MSDDPRCYRRPDGTRTLEDHHLDDCDNPRCKGCQPCTRAHCTVCERTHAATVCADCIHTTREDLVELLRLNRRLKAQMHTAGRDGKLAAAQPIPGGNAAVYAGPAADDNQFKRWLPNWQSSDPEPVLYRLATWESFYRKALNLRYPTKKRHRWHPQRDTPPARTDVDAAFRFLYDHLSDFVHHARPPFADFAEDLKSGRMKLEDELYDGARDAPSAATCHRCHVEYIRYCDPPTQCTCQPRIHKAHGGLRDEFECPRCHDIITWGQYLTRVARDYRDNAAYLPAVLLEERTGIKSGQILIWSYRGHIRRQGRDQYARQLYDVSDVEARAHQLDLCGCPPQRDHADHIRQRCCIQCHSDQTCRFGLQAATPPTRVVAS